MLFSEMRKPIIKSYRKVRSGDGRQTLIFYWLRGNRTPAALEFSTIVRLAALS